MNIGQNPLTLYGIRLSNNPQGAGGQTLLSKLVKASSWETAKSPFVVPHSILQFGEQQQGIQRHLQLQNSKLYIKQMQIHIYGQRSTWSLIRQCCIWFTIEVWYKIVIKQSQIVINIYLHIYCQKLNTAKKIDLIFFHHYITQYRSVNVDEALVKQRLWLKNHTICQKDFLLEITILHVFLLHKCTSWKSLRLTIIVIKYLFKRQLTINIYDYFF